MENKDLPKKPIQEENDKISEIEDQICPICSQKKMVLTEAERDVPHFGVVYLFSMLCKNCGFHKADVEAQEQKEPCRYTIEVSSEADMSIRVIKSSEATVKILHIASIEPGVASQGFITNIEGLLSRVKVQIEGIKESGGEDEDDDNDEARKKAKNLLKKLTRIIWGQEKQKIIIEDPTGNSAIISDKAVKERMK